MKLSNLLSEITRRTPKMNDKMDDGNAPPRKPDESPEEEHDELAEFMAAYDFTETDEELEMEASNSHVTDASTIPHDPQPTTSKADTSMASTVSDVRTVIAADELQHISSESTTEDEDDLLDGDGKKARKAKQRTSKATTLKLGPRKARIASMQRKEKMDTRRLLRTLPKVPAPYVMEAPKALFDAVRRAHKEELNRSDLQRTPLDMQTPIGSTRLEELREDMAELSCGNDYIPKCYKAASPYGLYEVEPEKYLQRAMAMEMADTNKLQLGSRIANALLPSLPNLPIWTLDRDCSTLIRVEVPFFISMEIEQLDAEVMASASHAIRDLVGRMQKREEITIHWPIGITCTTKNPFDHRIFIIGFNLPSMARLTQRLITEVEKMRAKNIFYFPKCPGSKRNPGEPGLSPTKIFMGASLDLATRYGTALPDFYFDHQCYAR